MHNNLYKMNKEPIYLYVYLGEGSHVDFHNKRLEGLSGVGYLGKIKLEPEENEFLLEDKS